jgi:hypothetical protein
MMETYSHLSPRCRIYNIERDIEKEHKELVAKFKASALRAQSYLAHSGWEYKELSLCCSNKERSVIKRRHEERLSTAKVAWEAAQHESKCVFKAAEKACVAAARLAEREQDDGKIKSRLVKAKAEEKAARKRCKSALKAAEKAFRIEVRLAEEEQKGRLLRARRDVCKNWDGSESRLERVLDNIASSGHASMEQMDSINKRMGRAQTLSLSLRECSEDEIAEMMEEESQLCQGVLTDIRRMQLASSSGKSPPASRQKKDTKTIQRGKALAEARGMLRILGRYRKDWDSTRGRCKTTSKGHIRQGWRSKSRVNGRGRRRKSHPLQGPTHSHSTCCGCCFCFCARHLGGSDPGREFASSSQLAMARSYFANAGILAKVEQHAPDASSLSLLLLATALVFCSLSSLPAMLENKRRAMPATTAFAAGNGKFITLETICMCLVFFAALPEGALLLSSVKCLTLKSAAPSDAIMAVRAKIEAEWVDEHASTTWNTVSSESCPEHKEWGEPASQNKRCSDQPAASNQKQKRAMAAAAAAELKLNQKWGGDGAIAGRAENDSPREEPRKIPVVVANSTGGGEVEEVTIGSPQGARSKAPAQGTNIGHISFRRNTRATNVELPTLQEVDGSQQPEQTGGKSRTGAEVEVESAAAEVALPTDKELGDQHTHALDEGIRSGAMHVEEFEFSQEDSNACVPISMYESLLHSLSQCGILNDQVMEHGTMLLGPSIAAEVRLREGLPDAAYVSIEDVLPFIQSLTGEANDFARAVGDLYGEDRRRLLQLLENDNNVAIGKLVKLDLHRIHILTILTISFVQPCCATVMHARLQIERMENMSYWIR